MTTINNIEDFIRVLDEHPQWLEAARSRLLSRALLDLPEEFARFQAEVRQSTETANQRLTALEDPCRDHEPAPDRAGNPRRDYEPTPDQRGEIGLAQSHLTKYASIRGGYQPTADCSPWKPTWVL